MYFVFLELEYYILKPIRDNYSYNCFFCSLKHKNSTFSSCAKINPFQVFFLALGKSMGESAISWNDYVHFFVYISLKIIKSKPYALA